MSDSLLMLLEMIEEVLEEAKGDVVPGSSFDYVPAPNADKNDPNVVEIGGALYVKKPMKFSSRGSSSAAAGKKGEENAAEIIKNYFRENKLTNKYSLQITGGSSANPDLKIINNLTGEEIKIESKTKIGSSLDFGQGGLKFVGGDNNWQLKASSNRQLNLAMRDSVFQTIATQLPENANDATPEILQQLQDELGIKKSLKSFDIQQSPVKNFSHRIAGYYKDKGNKYIIIGDKILGLDNNASKTKIPNLGDNQIVKDKHGRLLVRFKDHQGSKSYTIAQRPANNFPKNIGLPIEEALPLIFP